MLNQHFFTWLLRAFIITTLSFSFNTQATMITQSINMDGGQEVGASGDPDGSAFGTISFNDVTGVISWNFLYFNIAAPTAMHIHGPNGPAGINAGVFINLGIATSGGAGTLIDTLTANVADVAMIISNPGDFYVNIHNNEFPPGAVRGQVPVPATLLLLALGLISLGLTRSK
ncbi:CHRD domain-containing protein [Spartinivicinus poritis]|uniref:CHRD domain-containing protein n=1 Tax=Spartinivicinus poritis TaxID=2994640 RepID=A0ABT5U706_9GAMM|nr:CHRD domain-containing protein [Spartinivicinus sp. A2-2]MDE1462154.1 CHRD domain-containing protein [Spartinivicinus sp. A2-2]